MQGLDHGFPLKWLLFSGSMSQFTAGYLENMTTSQTSEPPTEGDVGNIFSHMIHGKHIGDVLSFEKSSMFGRLDSRLFVDTSMLDPKF